MAETGKSGYAPLRVYSLLSVRNLYSLLVQSFRRGFVFPGERHDFWELSLLLSGEAVITAEDKVYFAREGDLVLHRPNSFHSFRAEGETGCKLFTVSFDGSGLEKNLSPGQYRATEAEQANIQSVLAESAVLWDRTGEQNFTAFSSAGAAEGALLQMIKSHLELLCLSLMRRGAGERHLPAGDDQARTYMRIVAYLKENVNRNLTLQEIAQGVYESPGKIKTLFRSFTGGGVMQYFNHLRREQIMSLLSQGFSVKDIADRMNFSSPYYLSYFFKRETGITPREYVKKQSTAAK